MVGGPAITLFSGTRVSMRWIQLAVPRRANDLSHLNALAPKV